MRWLSEFESFESTVAAINKALSASLIDIYDIVLACAGSPTTLPQKSKGGAGVGANCHCEFQSFERTVDPTNTAISVTPFYI
jgi:hypothetical protein